MRIALDEVVLRDTPTVAGDPDVRIVPNPAHGMISITRPRLRGSPLCFDVYNALGIRVLSSEGISFAAWETRRSISVSALSAGVYFLVKRGERAPIQRFTVIR
jgi:hypothetical protein